MILIIFYKALLNHSHYTQRKRQTSFACVFFNLLNLLITRTVHSYVFFPSHPIGVPVFFYNKLYRGNWVTKVEAESFND